MSLQKLQRHVEDCVRLDMAKRSFGRQTTPQLRELAAREVNKHDGAAKFSAGELKRSISIFEDELAKLVASAKQEVIYRREPLPVPADDAYTTPSMPVRGESWAAWFMEVVRPFFRRIGVRIRRGFGR